MRITINHNKAWAWVIPAPGDTIGMDEPTMPVDDTAPHVVRVKRLQDMATHTIVEIPDETASRWANERAWRELAPEEQQAGTKPTATRRHLHAAVAQHLGDVIHRSHAPIEHWSDIQVDGDAVLTRHLRDMFLESQRGLVESQAGAEDATGRELVEQAPPAKLTAEDTAVEEGQA